MIAYGQNYSIINWLREQKSRLPQTDYVLISYYEEDNEDVRPRRADMDLKGLGENFKSLHKAFPNAKIGFGEFGAQCEGSDTRKTPECTADQVEHIKRYYQTLDAAIRRELAQPQNDWGSFEYIGGYFYWHFSTDVVKNGSKQTRDALKDAFTEWKKDSGK